MKFGIFQGLLILGFWTTACKPAAENSTTSSSSNAQAFNLNESAIVEVMCRDANVGGSGPIISSHRSGGTIRYRALTNHHVIQNCNNRVDVVLTNGKKINANVEKSKPADLDVVLISFTSSISITPFKLIALDPQKAIGQEVIALGYPARRSDGSSRSVSEKSLASRKGRITQYYATPKVGSSYGSTALTEQGMSGGPVINSEGLIAINQRSGPKNRSDFATAEDLNAFPQAETVGLNLVSLAQHFNLNLVQSGASPSAAPSQTQEPANQSPSGQDRGCVVEVGNQTYEDEDCDGLRDL